MKLKDVLFVVGARPNFIKIAPLCVALREAGGFPFRIVHTGQHYDASMSDIFFMELNIPRPDFFLSIGSGGHGVQTGKMMIELERLCLKHGFGSIVVIGDVNSTLAGALVGSKLHIPVAHIEAGLRSYNRMMPEEINRVATDHISDLLFAPSEKAMHILAGEGLAKRSVFSGDVMFDMIRIGLDLAFERSTILDSLQLKPGAFYLATLHRPYNVDEPYQLKQIIKALSAIDEKIILSTHPRLKKNLELFGIEPGPNIHISSPLGYLDFIFLEKHAKRIITDSGGVQKEAYFLETPCITLRPETEWVETVETGANLLVRDRSKEAILEAIYAEINPNFESQPYGDGNASQIILNHLADLLHSGTS